jgi:6-phosphofructokinase 1
MADQSRTSLGVFTSGGDASGMNAAVRAVVRSGLHKGCNVFAIDEGYQGMVDGGDRIRPMDWNSVGGIIQRGGTVIGSARCKEFREREGRLRAAHNLLERGIDKLVAIGGDGSLTGANEFRQEWPSLLTELVEKGMCSDDLVRQHPYLSLVGLVGSIDNDMFGTDMTIGADTALHRIIEATDAITSTAASHQRTFVVEVMGRNCGYLALMSGMAAPADWILIPEHPPTAENWEEIMCDALEVGRRAGNRDSIVIIAEGARDAQGNRIDGAYIQKVLEERLGQDVRITILGHVQRGGAPSAFDRNMATILGFAAVDELLAATPDSEPQLIGIRENRVTKSSLMDCVAQTHAVADTIKAGDYEKAMEMRGGSFKEAFETFRTLVRARPRPPQTGQKRFRIAVLNSGGPAPGMNTATRAAVRLALDQGHIMLGVNRGIRGLVDDSVQEMNWMSVGGWASRGGAELGASRKVLKQGDMYAIARTIEKHDIQALLVISGWSGYEAVYSLHQARADFPAFEIPIICLPASIDNNLPGSELSIGADTAVNNIVTVVDKIKQSAVASRRCFVVEVMGHYCGYLALTAGLATGAERVYLNEEGVSINDLREDVERLKDDFREGKRVGLLIRNEFSNPTYDTVFLTKLFAEEGQGLFEVRQAILGHLQQGGDPTPFDRIQATRMAARCVRFLIDELNQGGSEAAFIGLQNGRIQIHDFQDFPRMSDREHLRPKTQWWMDLRPIVRTLASAGPDASMVVE